MNRITLGDKLSVQEYTRLRVTEGLSDSQVLERLGYSKNSRNILLKWKEKNNVPFGKSKIDLIPPDVIKKELCFTSVRELCIKYNIERPILRSYFEVHNIPYTKWSRD